MTMRDLTGAPAFEYEITKTPNIYDLILDADSQHYIITASCDYEDENSIAHLKQKGLAPEHSYSIIKAVKVKDKKGKEVQLC